MRPGQALCGAKNRAGNPCKRIAMANGRCPLHGGKSTGPKDPHVSIGTSNPSYTHGIYTKFFHDEEKSLIDEGAVRLGQVDDELRVMRIRLKRALEAKELWEAERGGKVDGASEETSLVLVERVDGEAAGAEGSTIPIEKLTKRLPDFDKIIDTTLARIESLEKTRKELMKVPEDDPDAVDGEGSSRDRVTFTGGLAGGNDDDLPSPFADAKKSK